MVGPAVRATSDFALIAGEDSPVNASADGAETFTSSFGGRNGIRASSGENGKGVGTGGPHEAGTRSEAGTPVPFGGKGEGIRGRDAGSLAGFKSGECSEITGWGGAIGFLFSCVVCSGSAAARVLAVAVSTCTRGKAEDCRGSIFVPKRSVSLIVACKIGVSTCGMSGSRC